MSGCPCLGTVRSNNGGQFGQKGHELRFEVHFSVT